jgi:hypothetical protein
MTAEPLEPGWGKHGATRRPPNRLEFGVFRAPPPARVAASTPGVLLHTEIGISPGLYRA